MKLEDFFDRKQHEKSSQHRRVSARYDLWYTLNDFVAGLTFIAGSVLFFYQSMQTPATWLFLVGSILFTVRPAIGLLQKMHLQRLVS